MILSWSKLSSRSSRVVKSFTGLSELEFSDLAASFSKVLRREQKKRWHTVSSKERQRESGAGRQPNLLFSDAHGSEDALLFILVYLRIYPTQDVQSLFFGGTQAWAHKWIHRLTPVLEKTLGTRHCLPIRGKISRRPGRPIGTLEELFKEFPELESIIDATERPIRRPKNKDRQKKNYSGKKKRHTIKNTVLSDKSGRKILYVGSTFPGAVHDKKMVDQEPLPFSDGVTLFQDTGYQGYCPPGVTIKQPRKKKKGKERSAEDKAYNKEISSIRVRVEHAIGGIKRSKISTDIYRNFTPGFETTTLLIAAGLHNFRMEMRN